MSDRATACPGRRQWLAASATAALAAGLAGCGFQLRQPPRLAFASIHLQDFSPKSQLAEELRRQLAQQVQLLDNPAQADVVLQALEDRRDRSIVASTSAAQVRDLQLRVALRFRAYTPTGRELIPRNELLAKRELSYSETAALAKAFEEAALFRDMQNDIVRQVLRRLATVVV